MNVLSTHKPRSYASLDKQLDVKQTLVVAAGLANYISLCYPLKSKERRELVCALIGMLDVRALRTVYKELLKYDDSRYFVQDIKHETLINLLLRYYDYGSIHIDLLPSEVREGLDLARQEAAKIARSRR